MNEEDKRYYKRYKTQYQCEVIVGGESFKGPVIDYSDGLGAVFVYTPLITRGAAVDVSIPDMQMEFRGEVAWTSRDGDYMSAGFKRIGNLTGNLQYYKLADILIGIHRSAKTGILEIKSGSLVKKVYIKNGDMIFATSNNRDERLGEILVKEGTISFAAYNKASRILIKTGQKLGKILVDIGAMTPKELFQGLRRQIEEIILRLFEIQEGSFEIREEPLPAEELITLQISSANIIYKGIKRLNNFLYVRDMCPSGDNILIQSQNPINIFQAIKLSGYDRAILYHVNGSNTLEEILAASPLNDFETLKTIAALLSIRLISEQGKEADPEKHTIENIFDSVDEQIPKNFLEKMEEMFQKCESVGYYDVLEVAHEAGAEEITRAYYRLSKQFHPDRHFSFPGLNIKGKLIKIFSYITEAFEVLIDPARKRQYDEAFHDESLTNETHGESLSEAGQSPVESETATEDTRIADNLVVIADDMQLDQGPTPEAVPPAEKPPIQEGALAQEPVSDQMVNQESSSDEVMPAEAKPAEEVALSEQGKEAGHEATAPEEVPVVSGTENEAESAREPAQDTDIGEFAVMIVQEASSKNDDAIYPSAESTRESETLPKEEDVEAIYKNTVFAGEPAEQEESPRDESVVEENALPQEPVHDETSAGEESASGDTPLRQDKIADEIYAEEESAVENMSSWQEDVEEDKVSESGHALKEAIAGHEDDNKEETIHDTPESELPAVYNDETPAVQLQEKLQQFDTDRKIVFEDEDIVGPAHKDTTDEQRSPGEEEDHEYAVAAGKHPSRLIRFYLPVMLVLILLIGSSIPLYNKVKDHFSHPGQEVAEISSHPSFHNDVLHRAAQSSVTPSSAFPSFRDDAFRQIIHE